MYSGEVSTLWKLVVKLSVTKHFTKVYKVRINNTKELVSLLSVHIWRYGCTWEVWRAWEKRKSCSLLDEPFLYFSDFTTFFLTHKYISDIKITYSFLVWLYVRVLLNTNGAEVTPMKFNARGTTNPDWFSQNNLTQSPWTDLKSATILKPFCINTGHATLKFLFATQDTLKMLGGFWLGDLNLLCREFCSARNSQNFMEW